MATSGRLAEAIARIPIIDNHCHSLLRNPLTLGAPEFRGCFSETSDAEQRERHLFSGLTYRLALHELAELFGCPADESVILERRARVNLSEHITRLVRDGAIRGLLVDTGFLRQTSFGPDELRQFDLSLAVPFLGAGAVPLFADALAMAPSTKLLYGSDGFSIPELHWLGARWGRRTLAEALEGWGAWGLPDTELELVAERVLYRNALALYDLTLDPPASTRAGS